MFIAFPSDQVIASNFNILSVMGTLAIVKCLGSAKFRSDVEAGSKPPTKLLSQLKKAMDMSAQLTLTIPPDLQAQALFFLNPK